MPDFVLTPKAREAIDNYMKDKTMPDFIGLEKMCVHELKSMTEETFDEKCGSYPIVRIKGTLTEQTEWGIKRDRYYTDSETTLSMFYAWDFRRGYKRELYKKCRLWFDTNGHRIATSYIADRWGNAANAISNTKTFVLLCIDFEKWFNERRRKFSMDMTKQIAEVKKFTMSDKPQSHGGVANLLKVLTKTMEQQGADIANIAKVQYAVCVQAGIYLPGEFIRDVAVAADILKDSGGNHEQDKIL